MSEETICAISTAPGNGAISLIRLTGPKAFTIAERIFYSRKKNFVLHQQDTQTLHFGEIRNNDIIVDEVLLAVFKKPHTYTGEDMVEISCHGSVYIQQTILHLLIKNGAQLAQPGEFTQRAYLNGKMDLSQAEAVADLIASQSEAAHKIAMNQMRGGFSHELATLRAQLLQFISLIELELDFSEEDVEFADRTQLKKLLLNIEQVITRLIKSFELGNAIKNGVPVAIVGEPNVGKSTLLNAILNEDKAIVSEIAGTTRDTIEDTFNYAGITYRFIDTAGLRHTTDTIESLGIERTYQKVNQAKIVLALFDARDADTKVISELESLAQKGAGDKTVILVRNKIDLLQKETKPLNHPLLFAQVNLSARNNQSVDVLLETIGQATYRDALENNEVIVTNLRHIEALTQALEALQRALDGLEKGITNDFLAMDIREVIHFLAGITGDEISTDEILGNIFSQFCIGK
ncbi:MAG: tRNA uridine-5-carboxymethylaminomethyl(34) synthesis GTPase MnmE [Bacteroidetes bacterium HGW-Bacteroidetes-4]|jgi:tRNA modification GTPase|nr:MAG: tRNA uridine-5-carboxymethylaminomethyl(34) synthesis GTPase MnmE [Bacteroidetes bacterium HGW-Bacteroidetes-4]